MRSEQKVALMDLRDVIHRLTEITNQTYGRRGAELVELADWQKLAHAERIAREVQKEALAKIEAMIKP